MHFDTFSLRSLSFFHLAFLVPRLTSSGYFHTVQIQTIDHIFRMKSFQTKHFKACNRAVCYVFSLCVVYFVFFAVVCFVFLLPFCSATIFCLHSILKCITLCRVASKCLYIMREKEMQHDENVIDKQFETRNDAMHAECVCLFVRLKYKQTLVVSITTADPESEKIFQSTSNIRRNHLPLDVIRCREWIFRLMRWKCRIEDVPDEVLTISAKKKKNKIGLITYKQSLMFGNQVFGANHFSIHTSAAIRNLKFSFYSCNLLVLVFSVQFILTTDLIYVHC